ncbi:MAG: hypothetical protein QHH06_11700 [Clostridiales bacterium]|jgi:hypothetical protein|nr:hypothetical protein [Eubacteriales bacterium]MDH7567125.1 hypothetical protein [Clostridiales bacterium]
MSMIIGELIKNDARVNASKRFLQNMDSESFIHVLVEICCELGVEIPIWTMNEERILEKKKEVVVDIGEEEKLRISVAE